MDAAFNSATSLRGNTLMLCGEKDEIISQGADLEFLQQFLATDTTEKTVAIYQHGYHMLCTRFASAHHMERHSCLD